MHREIRLLLRRWKITLLKKRENRRRLALFRPILPGANLKDRLIACCGAMLGLAATGLLCHNLLTHITSAPALVAPMGASAVLLFAVPASPLAQPWSIIGGNTLSALVGVMVAALIPDPMLAGGVAVALAIATMSMTRCLHPPGGAAALTAVIGGPAIAASGMQFVFYPVAVNSILLVMAGWTFHRFSGHSYPHRAPPKPVNTHGTADPPARTRAGVTADDLDEAIRELGEALDVNRDDLSALLEKAELHAMERMHSGITCGDIMAHDVVTVSPEAHPEVARARLIEHAFRTLPVVDRRNVVVGLVGHQHLVGDAATVASVMAPPVTAGPETPAFRLLGPLSDGGTHEVAIVDAIGGLLGVVTQTDLLLVMARTNLLQSLDSARSPAALVASESR